MAEPAPVELLFLGREPGMGSKIIIDDNPDHRSSIQSIIELDTRRSLMEKENTELERQIRKSMWGAYFNATVPPLLTQLANSALLFFNGYIIALILGTVGLSAQTYSSPADYIVRGLAQLYASGSLAVLSGLIGSNADKDIRDLVLSSLFWAMLVFSLVFMGILLAVLRPIYEVLGGTGEILSGAIQYSQTLIYFLPAYMFYMAFSSTLLGEGLSKLNMIVSVITTVLSALLTWVLVAYTDMGIVGAAVGNGIAMVVGSVICISLYFTPLTVMKIRFSLVLSYKKESFLLLYRMLIIGLGSALIYLVYAVVMSLFNFLINDALKSSGDIEMGLSAAGAVSKVYAIFNAFYLSFASLGYLPIASFYVGRRNGRKMRELTNKVLALVTVIVGVLTILDLTLQKYIGLVFANNPVFARYFEIGTYWTFSSSILASFQFLSIAFGQALGIGRRVTILSILCLAVFHPGSMLVLYYSVGGYNSLMMSYCSNDIISAITCVFMMLHPYRHIDMYIDRFLYEMNKDTKTSGGDKGLPNIGQMDGSGGSGTMASPGASLPILDDSRYGSVIITMDPTLDAQEVGLLEDTDTTGVNPPDGVMT